MKKLLSIFLALLFISSNPYPTQKETSEEADLFLDMMEYKAAIDSYSKAIASNPRQRDIRKNIGYAYFELGNTDEALKFLKEEIELFPDNEDAYDLLVSILFKLNKIGESDDFLQELGFSIRLTEEYPFIGGLGLFIFGMFFKESGKYDLAEKYFRRALERGHDPAMCHVQLMDMDLSQERALSPCEALARAVDLYGYKPEFFALLGLINFEKSKTEYAFILKAIRYFEKALEVDPFFKDALFNLACIRYNTGSFKEASEYFRRILFIEPENSDVKLYYDCSLKRLKNKKPLSECPQEINLSREFIENPDREYRYRIKNDVNFVIENINYLGLEFIKMGKFHEALRRYRNGLKIYPESPEINFNMGMVFFWLNYSRDAEKYALRALREEGYFGRLSTYRKQEILKKEGAKRIERRRLLGINAYGREEYFKNRGGSLHAILLFEWTFDVALKEGNYFLDAYDFLGNIYFKKGDFDRSVLAYKKVIEIDPEDAMGHYNLGCTYLALKDWENAEMEWKSAIEYEKEFKEREKRREVSDDELKFSLVVVKRPVSFWAHKSLGRLYLDQNLTDKALEEFLRAVELEPDDPEPYYEIGRIYEAKSEFNEKYVRKAIFYYERYLYLGGEKEEEVKKLLKSLK